MTNAITLIKRFIEEKRIKKMKKWSERLNGSKLNSDYLKSLIRSTRSLLELLSGNDSIEMLKSILTKDELERLAPEKYREALSNLSLHYDTIKLKERHNLIRPIRDAGFSFIESRNLGFKVSKGLWKTSCSNIPRNLGGGTKISNDLEESIALYLKNHSRISSDRLIVTEPVRHLDDAKLELYRNFPYREYISKSTFLKYLNANKRYKKVSRKTDVCDFCDWLRLESPRINKIIRDFKDFQLTENFIPKDLIDFLTTKSKEPMTTEESDKIGSYIEKLRNYEAVIEHKKLASEQRNSYNDQRKNKEFLRNKVFIDLDFKQKIIIGLSPIQVNSEYYNLANRTCLGFGITYLEDDTIQTINFDYISKCYTGSQDAHAVVRAFRILRNQAFFKRIEQNDYVIWSDCGTHFRNSLLMGYFFKELKNANKHVNFNLFGEKHGKNSRDVHFASISGFLKRESLQGRLKNSKDVVDAIMNGQRKSNQSRASKKLPPIITIAYELTDTAAEELDKERNDLGEVELRKLKIQNLTCSYNYRTVGPDFLLVTSVLSNSDNIIPVRFKIANQETKTENYEEFAEAIYVDPGIKSITFENLRKKNSHIRFTLTTIANNAADIINFDNNYDNLIHLTEESIEQPDLETPEIPAFETREIPASETLEIPAFETREIPASETLEIPALRPAEFSPTRIKPEYCRETASKKITCLECIAECRYSLHSLNDRKARPSQTAIRNELVSHAHASTTSVKDGERKRLANTQEQCQQLMDHYKYSHKL